MLDKEAHAFISECTSFRSALLATHLHPILSARYETL
jgi:hypothetical protein